VDDMQDIGWAIAQLVRGQKVAREGWNGLGQSLELQSPDAGPKMTLYIFINTVWGERVPWQASQTDILACDWRTVD
jgi:hypothetical protein